MRAATRFALIVATLLVIPTCALAQAVGPEFQINTYTTDYQGQHFAGGQHTVATDASGNFVVVWSSAGSTGSDTSYFSIQARRFNASGVAIGAEFQVNTATLYFQSSPSVAEDTSGAFVVAWTNSSSFGSDYYGSIVARRFDSSGIGIGDDFQVNTSTPGNQRYPSVAVDGSGGFVVAWDSYSSSGSDTSAASIQARRFDSSGNAIGADFQVNTFTTSNQVHPSLAMDASGAFVVAWASDGSSGSDSSSYSIQARRFNSSGVAIGADFQANTFTPANQLLPSIAVDGSGFVVAWQSTGSSGNDQSGESIQARRFNSSGVALGAEFQVNTFTTFSQRYSAVAADATGAFVVAWTSYLGSGSDPTWSIQARRYDPAGTAVGDAFQVNTFTPGFQRSPSLAAGPDETFVTAWMGEAAFPSTWNVFGRRMAFGTDTTAPSVTVAAPNGGEKVFTGAPYTISWTASDDVAIDHVDVAYSVNNGASYNAVPGCTGLPGSATSCVWAVPGPTSSGAFVRVTATDTSANSASDASDAHFTIIAGTPFITITVPTAAGTVWKLDDAKQVKFNHNLGAGQPVLVELNRDYPGGTWETVTGAGCAATTQKINSTCNLTVTNPPTSGFTARMRVTWLTNPVVTDVSDNSFRIQGRITVTQPNTAVSWPAGSTRVIRWSHTLGLGSFFDITIDTDGDLVCESTVTTGVAAATATGANYNWVVSGTGSSNRICVTNAANPVDTDISDVAFTITP